jgi:uncharacterized membrane protein
MKLKLSHKDYLLLLGIVVAAIVMFTTLVYTEATNPESKNKEVTPQLKTGLQVSPKVILKKVIERVDLKAIIKNSQSR